MSETVFPNLFSNKVDSLPLVELKINDEEVNVNQQTSDQTPDQTPEHPHLKPKSTKVLLNDIRKEYCILLNLINETGFTGIEDNYRIRESLNKLIFEIRKIQDFVIKIKNKNSHKSIKRKDT
jgi:hypothetical protein